MVPKEILEDCQRWNKNLSIAWIDYQKTFDSVPLSWVKKVNQSRYRPGGTQRVPGS